MAANTDTPASAVRGLALGGFMGTGKSTVARVVAQRLALPLVDTDLQLADAWGPIAAQFAIDGELEFRRRESEVVRALCDGVPRVVATGGGVFADSELRRALARNHVLITLRASVQTLRDRLGDDASRPLWGQEAAALLEHRSNEYADVDVIIDVDGKAVDAVVEEVLACIG